MMMLWLNMFLLMEFTKNKNRPDSFIEAPPVK